MYKFYIIVINFLILYKAFEKKIICVSCEIERARDTTSNNNNVIDFAAKRERPTD